MTKPPNRLDASEPVRLADTPLTIEDVVAVARYNRPVEEMTAKRSDDAVKRMESSRDWIENLIKENRRRVDEGKTPKPVYGINTGFGAKAGYIGLKEEDIPWVTRNLIVSHATGVGEFLHPEIVRAAMLLRANSLAQGYSGVRKEIINTLVKMLNRGVIPAVPESGSVGASGDLAPLAHLALVLSAPVDSNDRVDEYPQDYDAESGQAFVKLDEIQNAEEGNQGELFTFGDDHYVLLRGDEAMAHREIERIELQAKESLALVNGVTFSTAIASLALYDAENIVHHAEISTALALESLLGFRDAFLPHIQVVRHNQGQIDTADRILRITRGSTLLDGDVDEDPKHIPPQDPYSLRVTPQVVGAVNTVLSFIHDTISREINAATDNPLIFNSDQEEDQKLPRSYKVISGGNFHGAPIGYAMDFLSIVITDLGSLSERRIFRLIDPQLNFGLPSMLVNEDPEKPGVTSGLMTAQYLAANLVSECKTLAHPASVDSIPTSANQEDHVSMSMTAALHARKIVENIQHVIAIELMCAAIGLEMRINQIQTGIETEAHLDEENHHDRLAVCLQRLKEKDLVPSVGNGTRIALDVINDLLFEDLPDIRVRTVKDRYLRPYVLRMSAFIRSEALIEAVHAACGLTLTD